MTNPQTTEEAAHAHTDLNLFGAIITHLEGGHLYTSSSEKTAQKIIDLCKVEMRSQLRNYDKARNA